MPRTIADRFRGLWAPAALAAVLTFAAAPLAAQSTRAPRRMARPDTGADAKRPPEPPPPPRPMNLTPAANRTPTPATVTPMPRVTPPPAPRPNAAAPAATLAKAPPAPPVQAPPPTPGAAPQASSPARALSAPDPTAPEGATLRCKDGTYLTGAQPDAACDAHRGIAARFAPRVAPAVPRPKRP